MSFNSVPILNTPSSSSLIFTSLCKNLPNNDSLETKISFKPSLANFFAFKKLNYEVSDNVIHKLSVDYIKHLSDFNNLIPNTLMVLDSLKLKYKMHIITNGFKEVQKRKLIKSNLVHYFKTVTISEDVGVKKPDKLIFNHAIKSAKATIENSIMIGDNYNADILGANKMGMKAIYFNFHKTNEENRENVIIIENLKEILKILP